VHSRLVEYDDPEHLPRVPIVSLDEQHGRILEEQLIEYLFIYVLVVVDDLLHGLQYERLV
jgi:hypothetical protein